MHLPVICIFPIAPSSAPKDCSAAQCRSVLLIPRVEVNVNCARYGVVTAVVMEDSILLLVTRSAA